MLKHLSRPIPLAAALFLFGFWLEAIINGLAPALRPSGLSWPENLYLLAILVFGLLILRLRFAATPLVRFLGGIPAALASLLLLFSIVLLAGLVPQHHDESGAFFRLFGLNRLIPSAPFLLAGILFLVTLGLATLKRLVPWRAGNPGFLFNHLGLWIAAAGLFFGQGDLSEVRITAREGIPSLRAEDAAGRSAALPFSLRLEKFIMEEHPSRPALYDPHTGRFSPLGEDGRLPPPGDEWRITVIEYLAEAVADSAIYRSESEGVTAPAARIAAVNARTSERREGWISFGNHLVPPAALSLGRVLVTLEEPRPKRFASTVTIIPREGEPFASLIEVNRPVSVAGWTLYQFSYDRSLGRWSPVSIISARRDPWLPVVYAGFWLLVAGTLLLLREGPRRTRAAMREEEAR